jgi:hypothetical protein
MRGPFFLFLFLVVAVSAFEVVQAGALRASDRQPDHDVAPGKSTGTTCPSLFQIGISDDQEEAAKSIREARCALSYFPGTGPKVYYQLLCFPETDVDAVLEHLRHFPDLATVQIRKVAADKHLKVLGSLSRLTRLDLVSSKVTDAGMKQIANFRGLQDLLLIDTKIGDSGAKEIAKMPTLRRLYLSDTIVGDEGAKYLAQLQNLGELSIGPKITDAGLKEIAKVPGLKRVVVSGEKITGQGIKNLAALNQC